MSSYIKLEVITNIIVQNIINNRKTSVADLVDLPTIEVSEDAISREYLKSFEYINKGDFNSIETIREWIDNAPSVIPKPKEGYWAVKPGRKNEFRCSKCGKIIYADCSSERNYCPNCGRKNKVDYLLKWEDMPLKGADNETD